jgi:hypothetical protein
MHGDLRLESEAQVGGVANVVKIPVGEYNQPQVAWMAANIEQLLLQDAALV